MTDKNKTQIDPQLQSLDSLKSELAKSNMSLLVGAGFSKNVDPKLFLNWNELLYDMVYELFEDEILKDYNRNKYLFQDIKHVPKDFMIERALHYQKKIGLLELGSLYILKKGYREAITDYIEKRVPYVFQNEDDNLTYHINGKEKELNNDLSLHKELLTLPWNNIYTTNYDNLLEASLGLYKNPDNKNTSIKKKKTDDDSLVETTEQLRDILEKSFSITDEKCLSVTDKTFKYNEYSNNTTRKYKIDELIEKIEKEDNNGDCSDDIDSIVRKSKDKIDNLLIEINKEDNFNIDDLIVKTLYCFYHLNDKNPNDTVNNNNEQEEKKKGKKEYDKLLDNIDTYLKGKKKKKEKKEKNILDDKRSEKNEKKFNLVTKASDLVLQKNKNIVKLHGSIRSDIESEYCLDKDIHKCYVIAKEDYETYPKKHEAFTQLMRISLLQESFCLIGFAGEDPNFLEWLKWVRSIVKDNSKKKNNTETSKIYFLSLGNEISREKRILFKNHNIALISIQNEEVQKRIGYNSEKNNISEIFRCLFLYLKSNYDLSKIHVRDWKETQNKLINEKGFLIKISLQDYKRLFRIPKLSDFSLENTYRHYLGYRACS
ncbi:SIR2 family protein [Halosquirtibacter laminarini]|uniref:SIR2 family protein n=1 Tax=Halosquirtibacter laminarini TaxID=3374600 RepID=A0AC61NI96_9BACT|nr:SIR2 family protein [Prolixibacteraceae bacterium]